MTNALDSGYSKYFILTKVAEAKSARLPPKKLWIQQALNDNVDFEPIPFQEDVPYESEEFVEFIDEMIQLL